MPEPELLLNKLPFLSGVWTGFAFCLFPFSEIGVIVSTNGWYCYAMKGEENVMKIPDSIKRYGLTKVFDYLDKDPMNNMNKVMDLVNKFAGDTLAPQRAMFDLSLIHI